MKKTRFSEEEMLKILREADQAPVTEVAKKHGISDVTIYAWRKRFGKLEPVERARVARLGLFGEVTTDPAFKAIRGDPAFVAYLRRMKLPR